ncbi:hypothetical protein EDD16DRAFT_1645642 [Pisolithus croceorrhizus]|nr:hypothetical protein EV401DRAFT_766427 [Pisolithus croceorrhizus]KAI6102574.1 hypothetical protein EDD16DRAFT_1645642 [Pisolithus croceorrhizus]KAI6162632.1 hypothetical protein EDD17DRAFT_1573764 [Pisolithus thermaeus]
MHNATQPVQTSDRNKLRMERLRQIELEQQQWEQEALVMPEAWDRLLFATFESVKTEFSDLDGLSWSQYRDTPAVDSRASDETLSTCSEPTAVSGYTRLSDRSLQPYPTPSRSELAPFGPGDTVRVPQHSTPHSSLCSANQFQDLYNGPSSTNFFQAHGYHHTSTSSHSRDSTTSMNGVSVHPHSQPGRHEGP